MANSVENRVVSMKFDNTNFERNVSGTMRTLDKLKQSLNFGGAGKKSIDDLSNAAGKFDMSPMSTQIEGVNTKFLALSTIAVTALSRVTDKVISTGAQMVKSLAFDPINQGYKEYETNMNSIQTILANTDSKGTTLDQVNSALDELNTYADQTIYNFSEMTRNIGTFTAAGVDLDTSVASIKGIANIAAISGSSSQQAATAMYQLSQAIAAGSLKLQDWNSVVNAGMGGEVFQKALFESGKALGTIEGIPMEQTFEQWTDAGNTFRGSLEEGWITSEVLTNTLQGFTGDLTEAQALALGYTKEQYKEIARLGKIGKDAATQVKTLTQLFDTVQEAIGSGWSTSFRLFVGNFEEAKGLFTNLSNYISGFVEESATARNDLLAGWKLFGGRQLLLEGFTHALDAVGRVLKPIKDAFREIFPRKTAGDLIAMSQKFRDFAERIKIGGETANRIKSVFKGFFSALSIGFSIIKGIGSVFFSLVKSLSGVGSGFLGLAAVAGNVISAFHSVLVTGGGIQAFFNGISKTIQRVIPVIWEFATTVGSAIVDEFAKLEKYFDPVISKIKEFGNTLKEFFSGLGGGGGEGGPSLLTQTLDRIEGAFERIGDVAGAATDKIAKLKAFFAPIGNALATVGGYLTDFLKEVGDKIAGLFSPDLFKPAVGAVGVGLLGGIGALVVNFLKNGLKLDFGQEDLFESIGEAFNNFGGILKDFQTNIKADSLQKIAIAIGILTASLLVLSFMDTDKLIRSLAGVAVGLGSLVGALALLNTIGGATGGVQLVALSGALILLSGAVLILSFALRSMAKLSWSEMARGLVGTLGAIAVLAAASAALSKSTGTLVKAAFGLIVMSVALGVFSLSLRAFSSMDWASLFKGLLGVAAAIAIFSLSIRSVDKGDAIKVGAGLLLFSTGIKSLAKVVKIFSELSWEEMGKGFLGLAGSITLIVIAMKNLPTSKELILTATGLLITSVAILALSKVVEKLAQMSLGSLVTGLAGLAAVLAIVVLATMGMSNAVVGAAAMIVVAGALAVMAKVLQTFASFSIGELLIGLIGLAATLLLLAVAAAALTPVIPSMIALGIALGLLGAGFALLGVGAYSIARAFEIIAKAGKTGVDVIIDVVKSLAKALPEIVGQAAKAIINLGKTLLDAAPALIDSFRNLLIKLLDLVVELTPKIGEAFGAIISTALKLIREKFPEILRTGIELLVTFLAGVRSSIGTITELVIDIILKFVETLEENMDRIVTAGIDLLVSFLEGIANGAEQLIVAGYSIITSLLDGIAQNIENILAAATNVITTFITGLANMALDIAEAGGNALISFLSGMAAKIFEVGRMVTLIIVAFIGEVAKNSILIAEAGTDALVAFLNAMSDNISEVADAVTDLIGDIIDEIMDSIWEFLDAGIEATKEFLSGMVDRSIDFVRYAGDLIVAFLRGMSSAIDDKSVEIGEAARELAVAIARGFVNAFGGTQVVNMIKGAVEGLTNLIPGWAKKILGIESPSKVFIEIGEQIPAGLAYALDHDVTAQQSVNAMGRRVIGAFERSIKDINEKVNAMDEFHPTISPVLDLSAVKRDAQGLSGLLEADTLSAQASLGQAQEIATTTAEANTENTAPEYVGPSEVTYEQNIYSPTTLSARDIYRDTRSLIALKKEELSIP